MRRGLSAVLISLSLAPTPSPAADIQVAGLSDLNFGRWNGTRDLVGDVTHCVHSALPGGGFSVSVSGDGPSGAFVLRGGSGALPFQVDYNDGGGWVGAAAGRPLPGRRGFADEGGFRRCLSGAGPRQSLRIRIPGDALAGAGSGSYHGRVTLLVMPE